MYIYIYIYIYDCWFLLLSPASKEMISFTGRFTVSSRSFTDCGVLPLPLFYPLPLFTPGQKGSIGQ